MLGTVKNLTITWGSPAVPTINAAVIKKTSRVLLEPSVYAEKPFNLKILKTDIDKYMDADPELVKLKQKVEYVSTVIDFLESTIKQISNRGFQIKNAIDWRKFTSGAI